MVSNDMIHTQKCLVVQTAKESESADCISIKHNAQSLWDRKQTNYIKSVPFKPRQFKDYTTGLCNVTQYAPIKGAY